MKRKDTFMMKEMFRLFAKTKQMKQTLIEEAQAGDQVVDQVQAVGQVQAVDQIQVVVQVQQHKKVRLQYMMNGLKHTITMTRH